MREAKIYRIELDDYASAAFTSFSKEYFGDLASIQEWINALGTEKDSEEISGSRRELIDAFAAFSSGEKNLYVSAAYRKVPFMTPMTLLKTEQLIQENIEWEHLNTWSCIYNIRCKRSETTHFWLSAGRKYYRGMIAKFRSLEYESACGEWQPLGDMLWGYPQVLVLEGDILRNRLIEPEKFFGSKDDALRDWEAFCKAPDPIYKEFCNDIFGDG